MTLATIGFLFVGWYPIVYSVMAINSSRQLRLDRRGIVTERLEPDGVELERARQKWPELVIAIPAHNEEAVIEAAIEHALAIRWPEVNVWVIDDGSTDGTRAIAARYAARGDINVLVKEVAGGKAAGLNSVLARTDSGLFLILDADAEPTPDIAQLMAAQLVHHSDLAAVTGNPRVLSTTRLLEKLQAIEFSSTVATQRRGYAAWGRISTISGICAMFRTDALREVGGFDATQPTEDIEITWRLHCAGFRVGYEPNALVGMHVPATWSTWFRQRRRWCRGLVVALRTHARSIARWRNRAVWPLAIEAVLSILWCHTLAILVAVWAGLSLWPGEHSMPNPLVGSFGAVALIVCTIQIMWGIHLDADEDTAITSVRPWVPLVPLLYWGALAATVVRSTIPALFGRHDQPVRWQVVRPPDPRAAGRSVPAGTGGRPVPVPVEAVPVVVRSRRLPRPTGFPAPTDSAVAVPFPPPTQPARSSTSHRDQPQIVPVSSVS